MAVNCDSENILFLLFCFLYHFFTIVDFMGVLVSVILTYSEEGVHTCVCVMLGLPWFVPLAF